MNLLSIPSALQRQDRGGLDSARIFEAYEAGRQGRPLPSDLIINEHLLEEIHGHQEAINALDEKRRKLKQGLTGTNRGQITAVVASALAIGAQIISGVGDVIDEIAGTRESKIYGIAALSFSVVAFAIWIGSVVVWYRYSRAQQAKAQLGPVSHERAEDQRRYHAFLTAIRNFLDKAAGESLEQVRHRLQVVLVRYRQLSPSVRETIPPLEYWTGRLLEALPGDHPFTQQLHRACESALLPEQSHRLSGSGEFAESMGVQDPSFEHACYRHPLPDTQSLDNQSDGLAALYEFKRFEELVGCSVPIVDVGRMRFSRWATVSPAPPLVEVVVDC